MHCVWGIRDGLSGEEYGACYVPGNKGIKGASFNMGIPMDPVFPWQNGGKSDEPKKEEGNVRKVN